jgi:SH3-like domain-containing protein
VRYRLLIGIALVLSLAVAAGAGRAADDSVQQVAVADGSKTGLRVPRFVSLKSDKVNVRRGPSTDQAIIWVFARAGLPVEIIAESDNWRRVRDSEGADGWVYHSLLSSRRTVLITPWSKDKESVTMHESDSTSSRAVAELQSGVIGNVVECDGKWCELTVDDYEGYVQQDKLWGVYRGEKIE